MQLTISESRAITERRLPLETMCQLFRLAKLFKKTKLNLVLRSFKFLESRRYRGMSYHGQNSPI